jgi:hypothetical protein
MDAPGPMNPSHTPTGLSPQRARRWCVVRTLRDLRSSVRRGKPITLPNLLRLFDRRWHRISMMTHARLAPRDPMKEGDAGRRYLRDYYRRNQPFARSELSHEL